MLPQHAKRLLRNLPALPALSRNLRPTFSQYGEDIIFRLLLWPNSTGTYLDVGSHDPVTGSNTYELYVRGWRGVTVDPNPRFAERYRQHRPRQVHLVEGISKEVGELTYFEFDNSVYNTLSEERAAEVQGFGYKVVGKRQVSCRPLKSIVEEHLGGRQIDLLSVDCEGFDQPVLESLDLSVHRPTVIIVEDYDRFRAYRGGEGKSALHDFLVSHEYRPIAQLAFSAIYVATDWRKLMSMSGAYDPSRIQGGILP